jgi:hypothetical protein
VKDEEGKETKVHMEVHVKPATKPHPTRPKITREVLKEIAIEVQHFELRELAAFLTPEMVAADWRALGFEAVNARWGQSKAKNEDGQVILGGNNGVVWITIIPPQNFNILGAWYPMTISVKLFNGGRTYATYAIQTCPKLVANNGITGSPPLPTIGCLPPLHRGRGAAP